MAELAYKLAIMDSLLVTAPLHVLQINAEKQEFKSYGKLLRKNQKLNENLTCYLIAEAMMMSKKF